MVEVIDDAVPPWPSLSAASDGHLNSGGRAIGYARVSTADQRLDLQLDALSRVPCAEVFSDHGVSGAKAKRPGLDAALDVLTAGDMLVVYKLDRLGRSVLHLADLVTRLDREDIHFCSLTEGINTATPGGRLVFHVFAAVAEFGRDLIRENTINGQRAARERGVKIGRPLLLDEVAVIEAHRLMMQEGCNAGALAKRFGVSRATMVRALARVDDEQMVA